MTATTRPFQPDDAKAFYDLNVAWITQHFPLEDKDRKILEHPQSEIIDKGGRIVIAEKDGAVVGTAALIQMDGGRVELAKMCVDARHRGAGIGKAILSHVDKEAADMGAKTIWLESNSVLDAALRLYERAGYRQLTEDDFSPSPYSRCNTQMEKQL